LTISSINATTGPLERLAEMLRIRRFEEQCILLSRAGQFRGHYHVYIGQEATALASFARWDAESK